MKEMRFDSNLENCCNLFVDGRIIGFIENDLCEEFMKKLRHCKLTEENNVIF